MQAPGAATRSFKLMQAFPGSALPPCIRHKQVLPTIEVYVLLSSSLCEVPCGSCSTCFGQPHIWNVSHCHTTRVGEQRSMHVAACDTVSSQSECTITTTCKSSRMTVQHAPSHSTSVSSSGAARGIRRESNRKIMCH